MTSITCFGEILLRLSTPNQQLFSQSTNYDVHFGGSEANVAVSLAKMGESTRIVSRLPENCISETAITTFKSHGVDCRFITKGKGRLGLYFVEQGASIRGSKVIYDREGSSFAQAEKGEVQWETVFSGSNWLHISGITPALSSSAAEVCLEAAQMAKSHGMQVSMDLNFRKNLWQYGKQPHEVMPEIMRSVDVLLGDPATFNFMLGTQVPTMSYYKTADDLKNSYIAMQQEYPNLQYMAMTLREVISANHNVVGGALFHNGEVFGAQKKEVTSIIERIGGGDAFMAGLIYGLTNNKPNDYVINFATAASVLKMTIAGDYNLFSVSQIEEVMSEQPLGIIER